MKHEGLVGGKYELLEPLGSGAMGRVYRARHVTLGRDVAIKFLHGDFTEDRALVRRFEREARAAAALNDAHVVQILDLGHLPSGAPFIVMEYLLGCDLGRLLALHGPLPIDDSVDYAIQACAALAAAHHHGIIHRDVKPENLFLASDGSRPIVKVLDFGLAKTAPRSTDSSTAVGVILGSPAYSSPEQLNGRPIDPRTDIWSLGATIHTLVCGQPPFSGANLFAMMRSICHDPPERMSQLRPSVPAVLDGIVARCLRKDPVERWASAEELAVQLSTTRATKQNPSAASARQFVFDDVTERAMEPPLNRRWADVTERDPEDPTKVR